MIHHFRRGQNHCCGRLRSRGGICHVCRMYFSHFDCVENGQGYEAGWSWNQDMSTQRSRRGGSSRSMGSLIKAHMGLAFVHGCQFTAVPRLFHQVHDTYRFSLLYRCPKATVSCGYSSRRGRNAGLNFDLCPRTIIIELFLA